MAARRRRVGTFQRLRRFRRAPSERGTPDAAPPGLAPRIELREVPFFPQTPYHCGPAALATVLAQALEDFGNYVRQWVIQESQKEVEDPLGQFLGSLLGGTAGGLASHQAIRTDFIFFSMYNFKWERNDSRHWEFSGISFSWRSRT